MAAQVEEALSMHQLMEMIGLDDDAQIETVIEDLVPAPGHLRNLVDESETDVKSTMFGYSKRVQNPFSIPRVKTKRIVGLMYLAKDLARCGLNPQLPSTITREQVLAQITTAIQREELRQEQKKLGESLVTKDFQTKLKSQSQWEKWKVELESVLKAVIGANGNSISYVIRENETPSAVRLPNATANERAPVKPNSQLH